MQRIAILRDRLEEALLAATPEAIIVGRNAPRIGNTSCVALPGKVAETVVIRMDIEGIAISAGAACMSGKVGANTVIAAMGLGDSVARAAV
ncbi:hypothetical protein OFB92_30860, partial [Escherichia coli]|nr:hypothetical protein [Escherichia coli]